MYFGVISKLKEQNLEDWQIQEYLKKEGVLESVIKKTDYSRSPYEEINNSQLELLKAFRSTLRKEAKVTRFRRLREIAKKGVKRNRNPKKLKEARVARYKELRIVAALRLKDKVIIKTYSDSLLKEVYYYITNLFETDINNEFQTLSNYLYQKIGLETDEIMTKEIAKTAFFESFNEFIDEYSTKLASVVNNVDQLPVKETYISQMRKVQTKLMNNINHYPILIEAYLKGDEELILGELSRECKVIEDIIDFDSCFKFLLALNKKYHIEKVGKDIIDEKYLKVYSEFSKLFKDIQVLIFTYDKINSFTELIPSHISSLFYALIERRLILDNKAEFIRYSSKIHSVNISKIRPDNALGKTPFKLRLEQFLEEIDTQISSKKN